MDRVYELQARARTMLLIDSDNSLGSGRGDVDDGFAVAALLRSGLPVAGLASVGGNCTEARAFANNKALGGLCGYSGPYFRGARAEAGPRVDEAASLWGGTAGPLRVLALGPLTNVAAALARWGGRLPVSEVVLVGGDASSHGRFPPWWPHEFNLTADRAATLAVFASDLPLTVVPLDVARPVGAGRRELAAFEGPLGRHLARLSRRRLMRARLLFGKARLRLYDLAAAAYAIDPGIAEVEEVVALAHPNGWLEWGRGRPVRLIRRIDSGAAWRLGASLISGRSASGCGAEQA